MYVIRRACTNDIEQLVTLRLALFAETGELQGSAPPVELIEATRAYFMNNLPTENFIAYVAEDDGTLIACSGLVFLVKPPTRRNYAGLEAYIMNMYTLPEWRGKGIATVLMQSLIQFIRTTPARRIWLRTTLPGRSVYERLGFVDTQDDMELLL